MEKQNNTQRLRFPGFTGEWVEQPLSNFLFEHKTKSDGKCRVHSVSVSKGVVDQVEYLGRSFAAADTSKYNLAKPNDIIYTKSPTGDFPYGIVKMNKNPYNVIVSPLYAVYSPINKYIGYILDSYFESAANTNNYLSSLVQKGAKNTINITNDTFVSKDVCLPTDEDEQEKIASVLMEVDAMIAAQGNKVEALKEKKNGLMQQLFPQDGETTPRFRFPGFTEEWEKDRLGNIFDLRNGYTPSKSEESFWVDGQIPWFRMDDIREYGHILSDSAQHITAEAVKGNRYFNANSIIIATSATIGEHALIKVKHLANQRFVNLEIKRDFQKRMNIIYAYYYMYIIDEMCKLKVNVGTFAAISSEMLSNFPFIFPSPDEQQKIADCLSELDNLIASESAKLEALKDHKKGLMQQLFPQPAK